MKVAVLGSWRRNTIGEEWQLEQQPLFEEACEAIGETLASRSHELIVAQAVEDTADLYVSRGFDRYGARERRTTMRSVRGSRTWGAAHIAAVDQADAVVIIGGTDGSYSAGLVALLAKKPLIPVGCFGGAARELLHHLPAPISGAIANVLNEINPLSDPNWKETLTMTVTDLLEIYPRILIIHGRSDDRYRVNKVLIETRSSFPNLQDAVILSEHGIDANSIPELFEALAAKVDAAIAVVTPDDLGATAIDDDKWEPIKAIDLCELTPRARENVWVEVGWFWGRLGRNKIMILRKGARVTIPSDLGAVIRHTYISDPAERTREIFDFVSKLRTGLKSAVTEKRV